MAKCWPQRDSMKVAGILDKLYRDQHWVDERNRQRVETAKTPRGARNVDPASRSQFSTWIRERFNRFAPSTTYRLLDAYSIRSKFLANELVSSCCSGWSGADLTEIQHGLSASSRS